MEEQTAKKTEKKRASPLFLLAIVLILVSSVLGRLIYVKYVLPRPVEFTTFSPFERRIFDLDAEKIETILIGYPKKNCDRPNTEDNRSCYEKKENGEEIRELIAYMNEFRYWIAVPGPDYRNIGKGCHPFSNIWIETQDGKRLHCQIEQNRIWIGEVWYYGDPAYFQKLMVWGKE